jgi:hypothetical protein
VITAANFGTFAEIWATGLWTSWHAILIQPGGPASQGACNPTYEFSLGPVRRLGYADGRSGIRAVGLGLAQLC